MENFKIGDIVEPVPIYDSAGSICGQKCKCRCERSPIYHLFRKAEVIFIHDSGNVDLDIRGNKLTLYDVPTAMLKKLNA